MAAAKQASRDTHVLMKSAPGTEGGAKFVKYCPSNQKAGNGFFLWTRKQYEEWYSSSIAPNYRN
jgi:hypothetical protein